MEQWAGTSWNSVSILAGHPLQLEAEVNLSVQVVPKSLVEKLQTSGGPDGSSHDLA